MRGLRVAFGLLTTLPVKLPADWSPGESGRAAAWYPLVGLVVGGLVFLAWKVLSLYFPPLVTGALTLLLWVILTGGLHLDGLADCCDGLLATTTPERRLEIMKDPRVGAFGVTGLILVLLLKVAALSTLAPTTAIGILLATTLSRWCILPAGLLPLARPGGMGADFSAGLKRISIVLGAILPLGIAFLLGRQGWFAIVVALLVVIGVLTLAKNRIGGVTGDVFGLLVESVETAILLVFTFGAR